MKTEMKNLNQKVVNVIETVSVPVAFFKGYFSIVQPTNNCVGTLKIGLTYAIIKAYGSDGLTLEQIEALDLDTGKLGLKAYLDSGHVCVDSEGIYTATNFDNNVDHKAIDLEIALLKCDTSMISRAAKEFYVFGLLNKIEKVYYSGKTKKVYFSEEEANRAEPEKGAGRMMHLEEGDTVGLMCEFNGNGLLVDTTILEFCEDSIIVDSKADDLPFIKYEDLGHVLQYGYELPEDENSAA